MSKRPSYYPFPDDAAPMSCEIFREAPLPKNDPEALQRRWELRHAVFEVVFGTEEQRAGGVRLPFHEMAPEVVEAMPPGLRAAYDGEMAAAIDPRSGPRFIPHSPVD